MMWRNEYKPPRVRSGDLRTPVTFYKDNPDEGPIPGGNQEEILFETWAKVDEMWLKDMETAKQNGTMSDITITIRDPLDDYIPTNKHYVSINDRIYEGIKYNIKHVQPDVQDRSFINIVAEVAS